jgi:hypothetical protein
MIRRRLCATLFVLAAACSKGPPPDYAPDPGLVSRIKELRMTVYNSRVCPGQAFRVSYDAVLDDGTRVPFESRYDKDQPPRLHVMFLDRSSREATPQGDGSWVASGDPIVSLLRGYTINAALRTKPEIQASSRLEPEYSCMSHEFAFRGHNGRSGSRDGRDYSPGGPGADGPDVTVRLGVVRSPYVERLLVAAIEVGDAPAIYSVSDAAVITPRDWLIVETAGGHGGRGLAGEQGETGREGAQGCPGGNGGAGGPGANGSPGGNGGRGGRITIIAAAEEPFLAGLVDARSPGGRGGDGGKGGPGGKGGVGGAALRSECQAGQQGPAGRPGYPGQSGAAGYAGPRPQVIQVPLRDVFGTRMPPELAELLNTRR